MLRNYYSDLELEKSAGIDEIKKAYRRLAMIFHPDKNDTPLARQRFNQINEAYQVLSDPDKKKEYDLAYQAQFMFFIPTAYDVKPAANQATYRRRKAHIKKPKKFEYSKKAILWAKWINRISFFFTLVLFSDAFLPSKEIPVRDYKIKHNEFIFIQATDVNFPVSNQKFLSAMPWMENVVVYKTPIFGTNLKISATVNPQIKLHLADWVFEDNLTVSARPAFGIYRIFMVMPILLLFFSFAGGFNVKKHHTIVDYSIGVVIMDIYTFILMLF